jgi:hydrogenase-4 component F
MTLNPEMLELLAQTMLLAPLALTALCFVALAAPPTLRAITNGLGFLTVAVAAGLLAISIIMLLGRGPEPIAFDLLPGLHVAVRIDALSLYFILLVNVVALAASWSTWGYLERAPLGRGRAHPAFFHGSVNAFHLTMLLVPMLDNLVAIWIAMELTTLASAFLVSHPNTEDAWRAAFNYLIITSAGIIVALLGTMFLSYAIENAAVAGSEAVGLQNLAKTMNWSDVLRFARDGGLSATESRNVVTLSFLFILVGYGAKAGLAPMHTWLPDGHGEAPAPISALLSGVLLKCALYAVLRFFTITNAARPEGDRFTFAALLAAGLLSLLLAVPFILKGNRFKRVLAYHSLEHMGIITFGVGIGGSIALFGALFHCLNHAVTKALMFLSYGNVTRAYRAALGREPAEGEVTGAFSALPLTSTFLALGGLALVGSPPFSVFMSELIILWGAFGSLLPNPVVGEFSPFPAYVVAIAVTLFLISTTLIFYGLVRHLARIVMSKPPAVAPGGVAWRESWPRDLLPLLVPAVPMVAFGVWIAPQLARLIGDGAAIVLAPP